MQLCREYNWEYLLTPKSTRQKLLDESFEWIKSGDGAEKKNGVCEEKGNACYANHVEEVAGKKEIDARIADSSLQQLDVDKIGLDMMDRRYLRCIAEKYNGGPVGADTLSAALSEERDTIEEVIEPYLMQEGLVQRTPRGRVLTAFGFNQLGFKAPSVPQTLFDDMEN